jgi:acyl-CoA synthetase (AMP-forming)/AMP-acid ligase II
MYALVFVFVCLWCGVVWCVRNNQTCAVMCVCQIRDNRCTVVQYIGEICRYTLAEPPTPQDATHSLRLALGNGMRPDVWRTWQQRFGVPKIMEFYAATEGVGALLNSEGKENAIGFISPVGTMPCSVSVCFAIVCRV